MRELSKVPAACELDGFFSIANSNFLPLHPVKDTKARAKPDLLER
jgi:hypothetical protein